MLYSTLVTPDFRIKRRNGIEWLVAPNLTQFPWLLHGFSTRRGGVSRPPAAGLNLGKAVGRQPACVLENRRKFFVALRADKFSLASAHQVHSARILEVGRGPKGRLRYHPAGCGADPKMGRAIPCGDALMTADAGVLLSVRTADCLPILVADPERRALAAIHAGWRGALERIAEKTIGEMRRVFGSQPRHLRAALGPSIGACCYEVGEEVVDAFMGQFVRGAQYFKRIRARDAAAAGVPAFLSMAPPGHARPTGSGFALDLAAVICDQLRGAGLAASQIEATALCTSCRSDLFFSYRKEGPGTGRMMSVIGMRADRRG